MYSFFSGLALREAPRACPACEARGERRGANGSLRPVEPELGSTVWHTAATEATLETQLAFKGGSDCLGFFLHAA